MMAKSDYLRAHSFKFPVELVTLLVKSASCCKIPKTDQISSLMRLLLPISIIAVLLACCHYGKTQSIVINNPSTCSIGLNLTDGGCDPNVNVIPDPDRVVINVNNAPGSTLGVDVFLQEVQLIITHTWANDLDIRLKSPGGQEIPLSLDNGGGDDNYGDIQQPNCTGVARLSMNSCTSVVGADAPFLGQPYRPQAR